QRLSRKAIASNVRISVIYPAEECFVSVDINQIARIFSNLFTNSRDAINERRNADASFTEGLIEVSAYADGASVNFTWTDNGCGIPKEDSQRIFDAFFTKKQGDIGSGLGLHIIKTIVEAHSGQIRVSPKPGKGAHFCMTLPLTSASP
ncbi:MAG TPA: HAMP domain-containing sensor histidine kinase, partial [Pyrinomonadaceae bacterium]|nr:HAMP domain-containing sensor histidine kinase [Pyrinomonadaceae bacterium]